MRETRIAWPQADLGDPRPLRVVHNVRHERCRTNVRHERCRTFRDQRATKPGSTCDTNGVARTCDTNAVAPPVSYPVTTPVRRNLRSHNLRGRQQLVHKSRSSRSSDLAASTRPTRSKRDHMKQLAKQTTLAITRLAIITLAAIIAATITITIGNTQWPSNESASHATNSTTATQQAHNDAQPAKPKPPTPATPKPTPHNEDTDAHTKKYAANY
jgi:hypothetical protein